MSEAVRLVVWDLDETFWKGTLTEGGIQEYVVEHHDIVIELAKRGILSSICSKNDRETVIQILEEHGIRDYFVFPSISWEPKGMRLAQLVEAVQLRAPTIMFIDDNPNNLGEAQAIVPGLQVEDETFITRMLSDPRFKGKDDSNLTRLKQYQLLEQKQQDEQSAAGSNEDFLRGCDVQVYIEYDVEAHIDRAIELINRTNQLNYTKWRLPESLEEARRELRSEMLFADRVCGLVKVRDKYGDYGFVGFFMTSIMRRKPVQGAANTHLVHFCFSCRTLGMLIEQWVYDRIGRPELDVVGEVLTDLTVPRTVDWVREVFDADVETVVHSDAVPKIVLWGGCEAHSISVYLAAHTKDLVVSGNYVANGLFTHSNFAQRFLDRCEGNETVFLEEIGNLGLSPEFERGDLLKDSPDGTTYVFNFSTDATGGARLRHKFQDWSFVVVPNGQFLHTMIEVPDGELEAVLRAGSRRFTDDQIGQIVQTARHVRQYYDIEPSPDLPTLVEQTRMILELIPKDSKVVIMLPYDVERPEAGSDELVTMPQVRQYHDAMVKLVADYPYAATLAWSEALSSTDEILEANHYRREVYLRIATKLLESIKALQPRLDVPASKRRLLRLAAGRQHAARAMADARTVVEATFEVLLRRPVEAEWAEQEAQNISTGRWRSGDFMRAVSRSDEFAAKWIQKEPDTVVADRSDLIEFPTLRVPEALTVTPLVPKRILIIGSCLSEGLRGRIDDLPERCETELYFVGSELPQMPMHPLGDYDFQIVQPALRFILPDSAFARLGQLDEAGHERLFEHTVKGMLQHLEWAMRWNREHGLLSFVIPFLQPVQNPVGRLMPRYDLRNPVYFIERLNEALGRELLNYPNAFLFELNELLAHHGRRFSHEDAFTSFNHGSFVSDFDATHDGSRLEPVGRATDYFDERLGESFAAIWRELVGQYRTVRQIDPIKLVVVDLDDTMWRGVMAEADPDNLPTSEGWPLGLWEALLILKRRGIMLAILSKNDESRVEQLWQEVFGRVLQPDDFVVRKINWTPKSQNMSEILDYVNLLPRNVLYIDDNPVERAAVQGAFPGLRVLGGSPLLWRHILLWSPETQVAHITAESASRTDMVRAQVQREDQRRALSHEEFLASLEVSVKYYEIDGMGHPRFARVLELVNKTNQFNTTGRRWSREEFVSWFDQDGCVFAFEVQDRYTHYGLVGVLIVANSVITQFVMSCRVLGLGVEQAVLSLAIDAMAQGGAESITGAMIETERNLPCRKLYAHCGFEPIEGGWHRLVEPRLQVPDHVRADCQICERIMLSAAQ